MALLPGDAFTNTGLAGALFTTLSATEGSRSPQMELFCNALALAIIPYIVANATVQPTALVAPPGGGPVTGTGNIT